MADREHPAKRPRHFPEREYPEQRLTGKIIASGYAVFRSFGFGFLESVYRRALTVELRHLGVVVAEEVPYELFHRGVSVGFYRADLVVESSIMVETKTGLVPDAFAPTQLLNCLCAAQLSVGLIVHFGPRGVSVKRVIASDEIRSRHRQTEGI
jgi:GxxExxY protein